MAISGLNWTPRPGKFLSWFSLFWIIAGAGFVAAGIAIGGLVRGTFVLLGGIWMIVGIFLRFLGHRMKASYGKREQLRATGIPGQARILSMTQTGMYVNEQPQVQFQLQVEAPNRPAYQVTRKEIVPLISLGALQNGQPLPVKIDPKDDQNLIIEWEGPAPSAADPFAGTPWAAAGSPTTSGPVAGAYPGMQAIQGIPGLAQLPMMQGVTGTHYTVDGPGGQMDLGDLSQQQDVEAFKTRMKSIGQRGEATITEVTDTGMSVGENKLFVTSMTINVPGKPAYESKSPSLVAPKRVPQLVVGATVPVYVDPTNPQVILADWAAKDAAAPGS
jgi:hypothetical protein